MPPCLDHPIYFGNDEFMHNDAPSWLCPKPTRAILSFEPKRFQDRDIDRSNICVLEWLPPSVIDVALYLVGRGNIINIPEHLRKIALFISDESVLHAEMMKMIEERRSSGVDITLMITHDESRWKHPLDFFKFKLYMQSYEIVTNDVDVLESLTNSRLKRCTSVRVRNFEFTRRSLKEIRMLFVPDCNILFDHCTFDRNVADVSNMTFNRLSFSCSVDKGFTVLVDNLKCNTFEIDSNIRVVGETLEVPRVSVNDHRGIPGMFDLQDQYDLRFPMARFDFTAQNGFPRIMPEFAGRFERCYALNHNVDIFPPEYAQHVDVMNDSEIAAVLTGQRIPAIRGRRGMLGGTNEMTHENSQSVHSIGLERSVEVDMRKMIADYRGNVIDPIGVLLGTRMSTSNISLLERYCSESQRYTESLAAVVFRATKLDSQYFITFVARLQEELKEGAGMCLAGRLTRLVNALSGLADELTIGITPSEDISNKVILRMRQNPEMPRFELRRLIHDELIELGYSAPMFSAWLDNL